MAKINNGGPAFPACNEANVNGAMGMSLRDWFAGAAMQAFYGSFDARDAKTSRDDLIGDARIFYDIADAMLATRSNGGEQ